MSGIPSWVVPGARVVCVAGDGWYDDVSGEDGSGPSNGDICTITSVVPDPDGVALIGLTEYPDGGGSFDVRGFRPLITLETDIATHFTALLDLREPVEA